jgi:NTE family protein
MATTNGTPDDLHVLVLQGGGALGSYQAGIVQGMIEAGIESDWIVGTSIGAINAALIAGNRPEHRVERLRAFWERVSSAIPFAPSGFASEARAAFNSLSSGWVAAFGVPGFFAPRLPPPALLPPMLNSAVSYYDTAPLRETLLELVDFELINRKKTRLSVGAVDVVSGQIGYFDNHHRPIGPEHIMASGALPPGFPPVEIDGRFYWDGGIVSNTPLEHVLATHGERSMTIAQIDLFTAEGALPTTIAQAQGREKDIRFASRMEFNTAMVVKMRKAKAAFRRLAKKFPAELKDDPDAAFLLESAHENAVTILQLIYRSRAYEGEAKDYEFSRATMLEHWEAGLSDLTRVARDPTWLNRRRHRSGVALFKMNAEGSVVEDKTP